MAANSNIRSSWAHRTQVPLWMSLVGAATGLALIAVAIWRQQELQSVADMRLLICAGLGLVLCAFGTQVSGTWMGWSVVGSGAAAIVLFLVLHYVDPREPVTDNAIEGFIEGEFGQPRYFHAEDMASGKLLGAWLNINHHYRVRIEEKHLSGSQCIRFVWTPENGIYMTSLIDVRYFKRMLDESKARRERRPPEFHLLYSDQTHMLFEKLEETPVSGRTCMASIGRATTAGVPSPHRALQFGSSTFNWLLPAAFAASGEDDDAVNALLEKMKSDNALIGRDARLKLLDSEGADAVSIIMADLEANPDDYKTQFNALIFVPTILSTKVDMADVRARLSDDNVKTLVSFILHEDPTLKTAAAIAIDHLQDDRANPDLVRIATGDENLDNRNVAAVILSDRFSVTSEPKRAEIVSGVKAAASELDDSTRSLLEPVLAYDPDTSQNMESGWVYVGTKFWEEWDERLFEWKGAGQGKLRVGDILTATSDMHLRDEHVQFDRSKGWVHGRVVGTVEAGQKVRVNTVEAVSDSYIWAEVEYVN